MDSQQVAARTERVIDRARQAFRSGAGPMTLARFTTTVREYFPSIEFRINADFLGFHAISNDVSVEYTTADPEFRWEVWIGKLSPAKGRTLRFALVAARQDVTDTIKSALRAGLEIP